MTPQQIVALGIRLLALLVGFYSLRFLLFLPASMNSTNLANQVHISYIIGTLALLAAALFWFFPMVIAHRILPRTRFDTQLNLQAFEAARVGCSLIGLWFAVSVAPNLIWFLFSTLVNSAEQPFFRSLNADDRMTFVFYLVEFALALILIFRSHIFARIVASQRVEEKGQGSAL
jgi:hypothetical protein